MKYLVSLPENTVEFFPLLSGKSGPEWFYTCDPANHRAASGGGTAWLLTEAWKSQNSSKSFADWLSQEKRILIHGGGRSRRLPAYASTGKFLLPIPVPGQQRGQRLDQVLLDMQLPLLEKLMRAAPSCCHTLVASGDVLVNTELPIPELPAADVTCVGLPADAELASHHGVFVCPQKSPGELKFMLQKPGIRALSNIPVENLFFVDPGIWILSDRAVAVLMDKCGWNEKKNAYENGFPSTYDLYGTFGPAMGREPRDKDSDIASLATAVINLAGGEFLHFGTSREIISSTLCMQNGVTDQKTWNVKPNHAIFIQNSLVEGSLESDRSNMWIENSHVGPGWKLGGDQVVTGIPRNDWSPVVPKGICLDTTALGDNKYAMRLYGIDDTFRGRIGDRETRWMNGSFGDWLKNRNVTLREASLSPDTDIQEAALFPTVDNSEDIAPLIEWMTSGSGEGRSHWLKARRLSADAIAEEADLRITEKQRKNFRVQNWQQLRKNYEKSIFYQADLAHAAQEFVSGGIDPEEIAAEPKESVMQIQEQMFCYKTFSLRGLAGEKYRERAFEILRNTILEPVINRKVNPEKNVPEDQTVRAKSPVRIDLAGGWTDTPPYCVLEGGKVVNVSLRLNGQPPLQVFIRATEEKNITLKSIDLGKRETVTSYEDLTQHREVGSSFSIPRAALCLSGFHPSFSGRDYRNLESQLNDFGCGLEISFLAAIPKGSGMGTSSCLAATILGGLSDFCNLGWDSSEICSRTLCLEQLLTTGGGWQDQYGGIIPGIKFLETEPGWQQVPKIRQLPDRFFTDIEHTDSMLLYYTGITRTAKDILAEIAEGMFLNESGRLAVLKEIKQNAVELCETVQEGKYEKYAEKVAVSWKLNNLLDRETSNPEIDAVVNRIEDLCLGCKLAGAGGGGYFYICARDPEAAQKIKKTLSEHPANPGARFVDMEISRTGLEVTRSQTGAYNE